MTIKLELTPEEAQNVIGLFDMALKHPEGGVKIMRAVVALTDKIHLAVALANKPSDAISDETHTGA